MTIAETLSGIISPIFSWIRDFLSGIFSQYADLVLLGTAIALGWLFYRYLLKQRRMVVIMLISLMIYLLLILA